MVLGILTEYLSNGWDKWRRKTHNGEVVRKVKCNCSIPLFYTIYFLIGMANLLNLLECCSYPFFFRSWHENKPKYLILCTLTIINPLIRFHRMHTKRQVTITPDSKKRCTFFTFFFIFTSEVIYLCVCLFVSLFVCLFRKYCNDINGFQVNIRTRCVLEH